MVAGDYEKTYLNETLPRLKDYLLQDELYWPVSVAGNPPYPQMTLGNILFFQARLSANGKAAAANTQVTITNTYKEWHSHWIEKGQREFSARMRQWSRFMEELKGDFKAHSAYYDNEVRTRAILQLLKSTLGKANLPEDASLLDVLDVTLWPHLLEGPFMWDKELAAGFPKEDFWFLYGFLQN
jgi:hypothetical protein